MDEIIKKCRIYNDAVGCFATFDGKCIKEKCFTYELIKENENLKQRILELGKKEYLHNKNKSCYNTMLEAITDEEEL